MTQTMRVAIALGPDGCGALVLGATLGCAIWERTVKLGLKCKLQVYSHMRDFTASLFQRIPVEDLEIIECKHGIYLPKNDEGVDGPATLEMLHSYKNDVAECLDACRFDPKVDIVIAVCAPHYLYKARKSGIPYDRLIRLEDHAWSKTVMDCLNNAGLYKNREDAIIKRILDFENYAKLVYIFPEYLTPKIYQDYYFNTTSDVKKLGGIFGGRPHTRDFFRSKLEIGDGKLCLINFGGTGVMKDSLSVIHKSLLDKPRWFNVILPHPRRKKYFTVVRSNGDISFLDRTQIDRLSNLMAAADLVVSRTGAGIVTDAINAHCPLMAVPENQTQVEAIRLALLARNLAFTPALPSFFKNDTRIKQRADELLLAIGEAFKNSEILQRIQKKMKEIPIEQEKKLAQDLLIRFLPKRTEARMVLLPKVSAT